MTRKGTKLPPGSGSPPESKPGARAPDAPEPDAPEAANPPELAEDDDRELAEFYEDYPPGTYPPYERTRG